MNIGRNIIGIEEINNSEILIIIIGIKIKIIHNVAFTIASLFSNIIDKMRGNLNADVILFVLTNNKNEQIR